MLLLIGVVARSLVTYNADSNQAGNKMSEAEFADWATKILVTGLILYMGYIMYKLTKESKAGKFGGAIIFLVLGFGVAGFVFKEVLIGIMS